MWRPDEVVSGAKKRGIALWVFMIFGILAYTSWIIRAAVVKRNNPDSSLALSNTVYDYPDIWVCLYDSYGCDAYEREEGCANSSTLMEGMTPTAVFYPNNSSPVDKRRQVIEGSSMLTDLGWCVVFNTSEVTTFRGDDRDSDLYLDYFLLDMYWYPGGSANASTTCVADGERWTSHKEWVYLFLHDEATKTSSSGMQISYSCITGGSDSHIFTTMGIGLTEEHNLADEDTRSYKSLSISASFYKDEVNASISTPYAYLAMEIQQEPNSLQIITEIDPLDIAEMLGNVGGFWDLILILWPIFFVAATRETPRLKPRNLKKSVARVAQGAMSVRATVSISRPLKRARPIDGPNGRSIQAQDQPVERPYWEPIAPAYKSTKSLCHSLGCFVRPMLKSSVVSTFVPL